VIYSQSFQVLHVLISKMWDGIMGQPLLSFFEWRNEQLAICLKTKAYTHIGVLVLHIALHVMLAKGLCSPCSCLFFVRTPDIYPELALALETLIILDLLLRERLPHVAP
jgi:hypothetical protein